MVEEEKNIKQTEFDSSVATLRRIDELIRILHNCKLRLVDYFEHDKLYIDTLDELFGEGHTKFTPEERKKCDEYYKQIDNLKQRLLNENKYIGPSWKLKLNIKYLQTKDVLMKTARDYYLYLMRLLDAHGMLLKEKGDVAEEIV